MKRLRQHTTNSGMYKEQFKVLYELIMANAEVIHINGTPLKAVHVFFYLE